MECINANLVINHSAVAHVSEILLKTGGKLCKISLVNPNGMDLLGLGEHCFADSLTAVYLVGEELLYLEVRFDVEFRRYRHPLMTVSAEFTNNVNSYIGSREFMESENLYSSIAEFIANTIATIVKQEKGNGDD